ncbi:MAG TPA: TrmH family RNA methyltransferase [Acidobacteriaceae bacterium]|nr:TrmH family RNA methyltransferase [Acidobacteriaceae bacterium]
MAAHDRLAVVLVATRNPLNIGAAARAMGNFGFAELRVVAPYDAGFREARSAVGASELLENAAEFSSVAEAVGDCSLVVGTTAVGTRELLHPLKRLEEGGALIREGLETGRAALLFGSEKRGLSNDDLSHCHWLLRIPTLDSHRSMNLGQAVAVCLYELARLAEAASCSGGPPMAEAEELERLTQALFAAQRASGYTKRGAEESSLEKTRRLVRRMTLNSEDAQTWTGILARINLRLKGTNR